MTIVASQGSFDVARRDGVLPTYHLRRDGSGVCWSAFARGLVDSPELRWVMVDALRSAEPAAYFFECAPWIAGDDPEVEWVLVPTRSFEGGTSDPAPFRELFDLRAPVTVFPNLRGDAMLVVPTPMGDPRALPAPGVVRAPRASRSSRRALRGGRPGAVRRSKPSAHHDLAEHRRPRRRLAPRAAGLAPQVLPSRALQVPLTRC